MSELLTVKDKHHISIDGQSVPVYALSATGEFLKAHVLTTLVMTLVSLTIGVLLGATTSWWLGLTGFTLTVVATLVLMFAYYLAKAPLVELGHHQIILEALTAKALRPNIEITIHEAIVELRPGNNRESVNCFIEATIHNNSDIETNLRRYSLAVVERQRTCTHIVPIKNLDQFYLSIVTEDFSYYHPDVSEERELEKRELDDLSAKITEVHTLTKERSKSGWLGFTVYDLDLPLDTQTREIAEQNEDGEYVVYEIEEPIGVRIDTIKELALSVTDGYGKEETRIIKGPFRKYGKRIRSKSAS